MWSSKVPLIAVKIYFADFCFNINQNLLLLITLYLVLLLLALHAKDRDDHRAD